MIEKYFLYLVEALAEYFISTYGHFRLLNICFPKFDIRHINFKKRLKKTEK